MEVLTFGWVDAKWTQLREILLGIMKLNGQLTIYAEFNLEVSNCLASFTAQLHHAKIEFSNRRNLENIVTSCANAMFDLVFDPGRI